MKWDAIFEARGPAATILIRLMVGTVFVSEGLQKFLFPDQLGVGRFEKIGFAGAHWLAPFVGTFEVTCGTLVLVGLVTRLAVLPLVAIMATAITSTKLPILFGGSLGPFHVQGLAHSGFWAMAHEARTDWSMLLGSLFLLVVGSGTRSLDARLARTRTAGGGIAG
ncbi:MAG TPA: DoxX family protein [Myxococcota bacterium]|nr:DoxX family protein [Myxococcota bacterium]